jgi:hypothetical protein
MMRTPTSHHRYIYVVTKEADSKGELATLGSERKWRENVIAIA